MYSCKSKVKIKEVEEILSLAMLTFVRSLRYILSRLVELGGDHCSSRFSGLNLTILERHQGKTS